MVSTGLVRGVVGTLSVGCIGGMIATQIADAQQASLAFGLVAAAGAVVLMSVNAVAGPSGTTDAELAGEIDDQVRDLVQRGATEVEIRRLVRNATELGRRSQAPVQDRQPHP